MRARAATLSLSLAALVVVASAGARPLPRPDLGMQQSRTTGVFELVNQQAGVIATGSSRLVTVSASAIRNKSQPPFGTEGVEIMLYPRPLTDADRTDILTNKGRGMKGSLAAFILFLDKERRITQVNMTYVVPGTTVARTVASTASELSKYFSDFHFDGSRLRLRSKGGFSDVNAKQEALKLSWDVDLDLPVVEGIRK